MNVNGFMYYLLVFGLLPPLITYASVTAAWWFSWRHGGHASAIYIPFLGPILLTSWIVLDDRPLFWLIPAVWIGDLGTVVFLIHIPGMVRELWHTSWFTLVLKLHGEKGIETATLTLHAGGHYILWKRWARQKDELGIVELSEPGTFIQLGNNYELTAHFGLRRLVHLVEEKEGEQSYLVNEETLQGYEEHSLSGWMLKSRR